MHPVPLIRDVADTARWVAAYRALESERPGAHFQDPLARRLAGDRGFEIVSSLPRLLNEDWALTARTVLIDGVIAREVASGVDTVLNLGAGLDTRPYRLALPRDLLWVEVDQEPLLREKERLLSGEQPACELERVALDLACVDERRALFERLGATRKRVLVLTEGLLIYLRPEDVAALGRDLAAAEFSRWLLDVGSPGLVRVFMRRGRNFLNEAPMRFGPAKGVDFFEPLGWTALEVHSKLKAAARLDRLGVFLRLASLLPDPGGRNLGLRPWSGVCLLERK